LWDNVALLLKTFNGNLQQHMTPLLPVPKNVEGWINEHNPASRRPQVWCQTRREPEDWKITHSEFSRIFLNNVQMPRNLETSG
jgi:hypothetical protein